MTIMPEITSEPGVSPEQKSNVIQLGRVINAERLNDAQECIYKASEVKREYADEVLDFTLEHMTHTVHNFGMFLDSNRINGKLMYVVEQALQAALYEYYNIEHPFQEFVEEIIPTMDEDGEFLESEEDGD